MAGLGEVASVIAVLQLSGKVVDYVGKVRDASEDRKRLRDEIRACKRILQEIKDDSDDFEEGDAWADTLKTLERLDGPLPRLQSTLAQVETRLRKESTLKSSLRWPFQERDVRKMIEAIEREKSLLLLAQSKCSRQLLHQIKACAEHNSEQLADLLHSMNISSGNVDANFHKLTGQISDVQAHQVGLRNRIDRLQTRKDIQEGVKALEDILRWLTSYDHASKHHDIFSKRQEGTGTWFLESEEYRDWLSKSGSQKILCTGVPRAGKTTLTSIVIDDLQRRCHADRSVAVAYIYCDYKTRDEQTAELMLSSLLRQLVERQDTLAAPVKELYANHGNGRSRLN
ncbi:hypothetical protein BDW02DRAFT_206603 [Decorospora gaudefroyi]|uniref:Nephrocystin 3-like N-terminal domain-containing protein n=1 Tax=Decorospora gaudefroyi TaxID=184978 RepID=A0A6A5JW47_9PLEO|nr:hypothetical protein BDW02DRAFT_206603 [Decorospora gaudefroyi]